ncbi:MAG: hypothetical protein ACI8UZ_000935 [Akkermansiaceae bacterium]|jgi:hypothetical protein
MRRIASAIATLVLLSTSVQAASLDLGDRIRVSTNVIDFNLSVFPGKAGYEGDDESPVTFGIFGDGTVTDYHFFNSPADSINSYADGGAGLIGMAVCPAQNINGGGESWSDLWTTNDPGPGYTTTPDFSTSVNTFARSANISGTIDISGLESGTIYIPHGTYINQWALTLTMTGPGQNPITTDDTQQSNGPSTNFGWITDFAFTDASLYDTISYTYTNGDIDGSRARFMGVILDGTPIATNPPTVINGAVTKLGPSFATVGGEVTDPGGPAPSVIIYFGDDDGGTNPDSWDESIAIGDHPGGFSAKLTGLTPATPYYFRTRATNNAGSDWADTSSTFVTAPPPEPPSIINHPPTGIGFTTTTLGGEVTSTGGEIPEVVIYWGNQDGHTNPALWQNSTIVGRQSGSFKSPLTGLSPDRNYFFRSYATNSGGSAWAPHRGSFTTAEISELIITEFLASNDGGYSNHPNPGQVENRLDDWIEIFNTSTESVSLAGWHLTDDPDEPTKWPFPINTSLTSGQYLLVYASSDDLPDARGNLHTNFKLNANGEYLALVRPDLSIASKFGAEEVTYPKQEKDISFGLHPATTALVYFYTPTPGSENDPSGSARVADTKFSIDRGIYTEPLELTVTTATFGALIYYTTNGEAPITPEGTPTQTALLFNEKINISQTTIIRAAAIKDGHDPTNIDTQTYLFLPSVATQPSNPPGLPASWGSSSADYEVDPEVTASTIPGYSLEDALLSIPSLSLNTAPGDLFSNSNGIYKNSGQKGNAWERQASLELIDPNGGKQFQIDCGVALHGASSRSHGFTKKHSLRLLFKSQFGAPKLNFPLFKDGPTDKFDLLILRACSTDSWPAQEGNSNFGIPRWRSRDGSYLRDQWMRDTQVDLGHDSARGRYLHLYLNGLYWGLYNLVERPNNSFHSSHFGDEDEDWDVIHDRGELQSGNTAAWNEMFTLADAGLASDAAYMRLQGNNPDGTRNPSFPIYLDLHHFIDYMLFHIYAGAEDWPCHNYWAARRRSAASEGFRFYVWDQEISNNSLIRERTWCRIHFELLESDVPFLTSRSDLRKSPAKLYYQLRQNSKFRDKFSNRVHQLLFNDGLLTPDQSHTRWMRRAHEIDQAIVGESARWGDSRLSIPHKRETSWIPHQEWLRDTYWPANHDLAVQRFRNVNLYPSIEAPVFHINGIRQHGGQVSPGDEVKLSNSAESPPIYFTTDGSDPRLPDGSISPTSTLFTTPILIDRGQKIQARNLMNGKWSALTSALFSVDIPLRVTEIMYNPDGEDTTEYLELMNISDAPIAIAEFHFDSSDEGIDFTFAPSEPMLAGGERIVVVRNRSAFSSKYQTAGIRLAMGDYRSSNTKLANEGEQITLRDSLGGLIQRFTYSTASPWPKSPDGRGPSLILIAPRNDPDPSDPENWRPSSTFSGKPGGSDSRSFSGSPNADLDHNGVPDLIDHGLKDNGTPGIQMTGAQLSFEFTLNLQADDVIPEVQISTDLLHWSDALPIFSGKSSQHLNNGGLQVSYTAPASALSSQRSYLRLLFRLSQ